MHALWGFAALLFSLSVSGAHAQSLKPFDKVTSSAPFTAYLAAQDLPGVTTILTDDAHNLLAFVSARDEIVALYGDIKSGKLLQSSTIVDAKGLNLTNGFTVRGNFIYASSDTTVYRWPYRPGQRSLTPNEKRQVAVKNIPGGGLHRTRPMAFYKSSLYLGVGSATNVDFNSSRAHVREFFIEADYVPPEGLDYEDGKVFADGLRNPVVLSFDRFGKLWEVETGPKWLERYDLGNIQDDSPAEEINLLEHGKSYGYPYCFSMGNTGEPFESPRQYAWQRYIDMPNSTWSDQDCQNPGKNEPPSGTLPAHSSPLAASFFQWFMGCDKTPTSFPCEFRNDLFVALHGTWDGEGMSAGFRVVRIPSSGHKQLQLGKEVEDVLATKDFERVCVSKASQSECFRPSGIAFNPDDGTMFVSSDSTGEIIQVVKGTWSVSSQSIQSESASTTTAPAAASSTTSFFWVLLWVGGSAFVLVGLGVFLWFYFEKRGRMRDEEEMSYVQLDRDLDDDIQDLD
ncbi:hypothetical protein HK102_008874 [Quaeritorhiza haematococci]|nr:hypothetical protein HK102_008874 [Quaeritorhiza haematococci]